MYAFGWLHFSILLNIFRTGPAAMYSTSSDRTRGRSRARAIYYTCLTRTAMLYCSARSSYCLPALLVTQAIRAAVPSLDRPARRWRLIASTELTSPLSTMTAWAALGSLRCGSGLEGSAKTIFRPVSLECHCTIRWLVSTPEKNRKAMLGPFWKASQTQASGQPSCR
jgi:hypothetical protein